MLYLLKVPFSFFLLQGFSEGNSIMYFKLLGSQFGLITRHLRSTNAPGQCLNYGEMCPLLFTPPSEMFEAVGVWRLQGKRQTEKSQRQKEGFVSSTPLPLPSVSLELAAVFISQPSPRRVTSAPLSQAGEELEKSGEPGSVRKDVSQASEGNKMDRIGSMDMKWLLFSRAANKKSASRI